MKPAGVSGQRTSQARRAYEKQGWALLRGLLSASDLAALRSWAQSCEQRTDERCLYYYESAPDGGRILSRVEKFFETDEFPSQCLVAGSGLWDVVEGLLGDEPVLFKDKLNFKPPGGGAYAVHQDGPAYKGFGIDTFLTVMVAIDDATAENGCLEFTVSRRIDHDLELDATGQIVSSELSGLSFEVVPSLAGDVVVFDGRVPHRSARNDSDTFRRALFLTYNGRSKGDQRSRYFEAKCSLFPPEDQRTTDTNYHAIGQQFNLGNPFR